MSIANLRIQIGESLPDEEVARLLDSHHGDPVEAVRAFFEFGLDISDENAPVQACRPQTSSSSAGALQPLTDQHSPGNARRSAAPRLFQQISSPTTSPVPRPPSFLR
uniref:Uncharacterized protein n=1 Tax=Haptolina brevifila TaxID=156173 RepID=A0A7S2CJ87_9EUKA|mmetsp:Transcript_25304/g.50876  ORF Transcript_25304/g.50876 Transcript_25304/m.50876 type:complete len:107 (+) Transcript_25304:83-403(+)|eukprot:CAMPEP_0174728630 /NCGR_PEP_ID=MMETSP1094-20130205/52087_1 /TAXON_ID=156173 /ORGANISM="Chrysochromulina brevifilum, Strain UTEX LB 985" /LENGTH=106 /DNA_ID=CAMNT_0015930593 /DNA_START=75 /DNA_END=395 /DNA_ORIENTATION=+